MIPQFFARRHWMLVLLALFAFAGSGHAAVVEHFTLKDLSEKADVIVHAEVTSELAAWNAGRTKIWTSYGLKVKEQIKGEFVGTKHAHARGGTVGRKGQAVSGEAYLTKGKEYLLFLWKDKDNRYRMVGMSQGAFLVTEKDGAKTARNSYRGLKLVRVGVKNKVEKVSAIKGKLDELIAEVKGYLPKEEEAANAEGGE